jgi:hypothetical protein
MSLAEVGLELITRAKYIFSGSFAWMMAICGRVIT